MMRLHISNRNRVAQRGPVGFLGENMKNILYFLIFVLIVSVVGCGKKDTTAKHEKELTKLGFVELEKIEDSPFEEWRVQMTAETSMVFELVKAETGWVYYPNFETDRKLLEEHFDNKPNIEIISLGQTEETPSVIVKTANKDYEGFSNWNLVKTDFSGAGYFIFYKTTADSWGSYPNPNGYTEPGYISNVSISSLKEGAQEYFESDPFGHKPGDMYSRIYSEFWDFDKGTLR